MNYYINNLKNKLEVADGIKRLIEDIAPTKWEMDEIQKAWDEVHAANMAKKRGVKEGREQSGGWDLIKPKDWRGPKHEGNTGFISDIFASRTMS